MNHLRRRAPAPARLWYGSAAYSVWGLFPIYWKLIEFVPADQIIAHRIVWSFLLLALVRVLPFGGDGASRWR